MDNILIREFAKITNDTQTTDEVVTAYGTIQKDGDTYSVLLDGSTEASPVELTMDADDGDRVTVSIKDHKITVTGNIDKPAQNLQSEAAQQTIQNKIDEAITGIGEGLKVYYSPELPTGVEFNKEDTWYKTDADDDTQLDALYVYDGTEWVQQEFAGGILREDTITAREIDVDNLCTNMAFVGPSESKHVVISSESINIMEGDTKRASFGNEINFYPDNTDSSDRYKISTDGINFSTLKIRDDGVKFQCTQKGSIADEQIRLEFYTHNQESEIGRGTAHVILSPYIDSGGITYYNQSSASIRAEHVECLGIDSYSVYSNEIDINGYNMHGQLNISDLDLNVNSDTELEGTLSVSGNTELGGTLSVSGGISCDTVNGYTLGAACARGIGGVASGNSGLVTGNQVYTALGSRTSLSNGSVASGNANFVTGGTVFDAFDSMLSVGTTVIDNLSMAADGTVTGNKDAATKTNFTPLCVVGHAFANATTSGQNFYYTVPLNLYLSGGKIYYRLTNYSTTKAVKVKMTVYVLYVRTS